MKSVTGSNVPPTYVLVTPARNEETHIGSTLASVVAQKVLPLCWIIVDDCSTDATGHIVQDFARQHRFVRVLKIHREGPRDTSRGKLDAVCAGYAALRTMSFAFVGQLDADITLDTSYYSTLMQHLRDDPALGIAGGQLYDMHNGRPRATRPSRDHVAGGVQFYRRACFEQILSSGVTRAIAEDFVAEIIARMAGWRTHAFEDCTALHWRPQVGGLGSTLRARYCSGIWQYEAGWLPRFVALRAMHRLAEPPLLLGSVARTLGYLHAALWRRPVLLPPEMVAFVRAEQRAKIHTLIHRGRYPWMGLPLSPKEGGSAWSIKAR